MATVNFSEILDYFLFLENIKSNIKVSSSRHFNDSHFLLLNQRTCYLFFFKSRPIISYQCVIVADSFISNKTIFFVQRTYQRIRLSLTHLLILYNFTFLFFFYSAYSYCVLNQNNIFSLRRAKIQFDLLHLNKF